MTRRRIKRQRHRRRRASDAESSPTPSPPQSSPPQSAAAESIPSETAPNDDATLDPIEGGSDPQYTYDQESDPDSEQLDLQETVDEDLEETAADPALEASPEERPATARSDTRQGVERPQTDGAPMLRQPDAVPAAVPEDPDHPEAFGRWLRSQRELRGIRLRAIADSSKISLGHLKALESGRFDLLPADVFTKGFLRQYAGFVGLDPEETINFYLAAREHTEDEDGTLHVAPAPKEASGARWVLVALVLAAVLLGVIWGLQHLSKRSEGGGSANVSDPPSSEAPAGSSSFRRSADGASPTERDTEAGVGDGSSEVDAGSAPSSEPEDTGPDPTGEAAAPPTQPAMPIQPADVPLRVVLDFSDTCWVSALIDGGETREKVHAQGESLTLDAQTSVELKVGNFRAVEVEVNGISYDLGSQGRSGSVVRTVRIDLETVRSLRGTASLLDGNDPNSED